MERGNHSGPKISLGRGISDLQGRREGVKKPQKGHRINSQTSREPESELSVDKTSRNDTSQDCAVCCCSGSLNWLKGSLESWTQLARAL